MKEGPPKKGAAVSTLTPTTGIMLQRKCGCGGSAGLTGQCEECREEKHSLQRYARERSSLLNLVASLSNSSGVPPENRSAADPVSIHGRAPLKPQTKLAVSRPADAHEEEADRIAAQVLSASLTNEPGQVQEPTTTTPHIQREMAETSPVQPAAEPTAEQSTTAATDVGGLIVEDDAMEVGPGQMRKTDFLSQLEGALYDTAEPILATRGRRAQGCPYLVNWIAYGHLRSGSYVETFVRRFAPGAEGISAAADYIPLVSDRMRAALLVWAATGDITGVPADLAADLPATNEMGAVMSLGSRVAPTEPGPADNTGVVLAKHEEGASPANPDARTVQNELGHGHALESSTRTRMESAFGYNFSSVRIHHDARAANLATRFSARAFTLGNDVAFAGGEYKPGTMIGDALLAHELAHVVQQGAAPEMVSHKSVSHARSGSLEDDADRSAIGAVVSLWAGAHTKLAHLSSNALPRLRSGLRLSRCDSCNGKDEEKVKEKEEDTTPPVPDIVPLPPPGTADCTKSFTPDQIIIDHRVTPAAATIQQPGDQLTFTVTFACFPREDAYSKFIDPSGKEFGRKVIPAKGQGRITRDWDGKKLYPQVGTYMVDDGTTYVHRIEPIKYAYKYNSTSRTTEELKSNESNSPNVTIGTRGFMPAGATTHPHFNTANVDLLAEIMESEMGIGNAQEREAIGWAVRNQMIRMNTADVSAAQAQFGDATGNTPKAATRTAAEAILRLPMTGDTAGGAVKWYSPKGMKELEDAKKNIDCGGGRTNETDPVANTTHSVCSPAWRLAMTRVTIAGARDWFLKAYRL